MVVPYDLAEEGGVKRHAMQLAATLRGLGDEVDVIGPYSGRGGALPEHTYGFSGVVNIPANGSDNYLGIFVQPWYARLFALDPGLQPLFGKDMRQQARMFMHALGAAVAWLRNFNAIVPSLEALAQRHRGYGVQPQHYAALEEALLWALERALGDSFGDELRAAWRELIVEIAGVMKQAAHGGPDR